MERTLPKVAILILNRNGLRNTLETLESVRGLRYPNLSVFLVDNGSTDGSVETIAREFPEVHLIVSQENLGVAAGRNLGVETIVLHRDDAYVMLLDNDVTLEPYLLDKLIEAAERDDILGIVGSIVYYHSDPRRPGARGLTSFSGRS
jgi:GT2 family glycosyltransferase